MDLDTTEDALVSEDYTDEFSDDEFADDESAMMESITTRAGEVARDLVEAVYKANYVAANNPPTPLEKFGGFFPKGVQHIEVSVEISPVKVSIVVSGRDTG